MSQLEPFRVLLVDVERLAESMAAEPAEEFAVRADWQKHSNAVALRDRT